MPENPPPSPRRRLRRMDSVQAKITRRDEGEADETRRSSSKESVKPPCGVENMAPNVPKNKKRQAEGVPQPQPARRSARIANNSGSILEPPQKNVQAMLPRPFGGRKVSRKTRDDASGSENGKDARETDELLNPSLSEAHAGCGGLTSAIPSQGQLPSEEHQDRDSDVFFLCLHLEQWFNIFFYSMLCN